MQLPAPGSTDLDAQVADVLKRNLAGPWHRQLGIDGHTWSVLMHEFPDTSIPVDQLSLNALKDFDPHTLSANGLAVAPFVPGR